MSTDGNRSQKVMLGTIATAIAVLLIGLIAWRAMAGRTPGPDADATSVQKFVASDRFKDLPAEEQQKYVQKMFEAPDPERDRAMRNLAEAHRKKMLDDYFALPEGKARQAFLDKQIDQMEQVRKWAENPSTQPGERVMIKRGAPGMQKEMAETVPAEYQGKMAQYMKELKDRRAARGLPSDGPGGAFMIRIGGPS